MKNPEFGEFVKALRRQRTYYDDKGFLRQWSQEYLALKSGLHVRQVRSVEQGEMVDLHSVLQPLADAFGLTELEKAAFYAKAGYVYQPERMAPDRGMLKTWLGQLQHPASIRTPLWDFVAFNEYHRIARGYTQEDLGRLGEGELGPNLLGILFSKQPTIDVRSHLWAEETIWAFREASFQYVNTMRYRQILKEMKRNPDFDRAWALSEKITPTAETTYFRRPSAKINHPDYGKIEFMSLRIPQRYIGPELIFSVYVPLASGEKNYQRLRENVKQNRVHFFRAQPLE